MRIIGLLFFLIFSSAYGDECDTCSGRIDIGPAIASIDMLESGHTQRTLDLWGVRGDATLLIYKGFCIKPTILLCDGKANLNTYSLGAGFCFPVIENVTITPSGGYSETHFKSRINFPDFGLYHLREKFKSRGGYLALDGCWTFIPGFRAYAGFQWAWSTVHTTVRPLFKSKQHCQGPSYSACLEYDLLKCLSVNLAGGYNLSLSKEKHGLRGKGLKLGLVYWY